MVVEPAPEPFVLLVEDDHILASGVTAAIRAQRLAVTHVESAEDALELLADATPAAIVLDVMLPGIDGLTLLKRLKATQPEIPVLLMTARTAEIDRVLGFELGADDYVPKPFSVRELIHRIRLRMRVPAAPPAPVAPPPVADNGEIFRFGEVEVDLRRRVLVRGTREERMTTHEAGVLAYLIEHRGQDITREQLLTEVWGYSATMATRTVDNQILKLRKKVELDSSDPRHILTVHGTGYRFEP